MSDLTGSASVQINADFSDFSSQLAAALGPAIEGAIAAARAGGNELGDALTSGIAPALDDVAGQAKDAAAAISDALGGITGVGDLTAGITDADSQLSLFNDDLSAVSDAVASALGGSSEQLSLFAADAQDAFANVTSAVDDASGVVDGELGGAFVSAGAEVEAAMAEAASALEGSLGPAAEEATSQVRDAMGRFVSDTSDASKQAADAEADAAKDGSDRATSAISDGASQIATIMAGVFAGNELSAGFDSIVGGIQDAVGALPSLGAEFQGAFNQINVGTVATGDVLAGLRDDFNAVAQQTPADLGDVGSAITTLNRQLGLTGPQLQSTALEVIRLSRITGTDLQANLKGATTDFNQFNVSADQQGQKLNELLRVYQETGISVTDLEQSLGKVGGAAQLQGVSFEQTASIVGLLYKATGDASGAQQAFSRILKDSVKNGVDAKVGFQQTFAAIQNGTMSLDDGFKLFGPRAASVFAQIRAGKVDFNALAASITDGGKTIDQTATEVSTWQGQLGLLSNQLKVILEPVATFVFTQIGNVVRALRPVIVDVANAVSSVLTPVWVGLVVTLLPVWQLLDRVRQGVSDLIGTFWSGSSIVDSLAAAIGNFVRTVTGSEDSANSAYDFVTNLVNAFKDLWATLAPVREVIASVFGAIKDAVAGFVAANPVPILIGIATVIGGVLLAAFGALAGVLGVILAPIAGFVAGLLAVPIAVGLVVTALLAAYNSFDTFHNIVDAVASFLATTLLAAFQDVTSFVTGSVLPWITNLATQIGNLWGALTAGDAQGVGEVLDNIFGNTGQWVGTFRDLATTFFTVIGGIRDEFLSLWTAITTSVLPALSKLWDVLGGGSGILTFISDHWQILAGIIAFLVAGPIPLIIAALVALYVKFEPVREVVNTVAQAIATFASQLIGFVGIITGDVINALTGLIEIIQGLFTLDWSKVGKGLYDLASGILAFLSDTLGQLPDIVLGLMQKVLDAILSALSNIPVLGNLFAGLKTIIDGVVSVVSGLFEVLQGILTLNWDTIKDGLGKALGGLRDIIAGFFGGIGGFIHDLLVQGLPLAWDAIKAAVPALLAAFGTLLSNLPGWILTALAALGQVIVTGLSMAWDWVVANGPGILAAVGTWLAGLPATILGWLGDLGALLLGWLANAFVFLAGAAGTILGGVISFFANLPAQFFNALMDSVAFVINFLANAIVWAVQNLPGIISGILDFFASVPGRIWTAVGDFGGFLIEKYLEAITWLVQNLPGILSGIWDFFKSVPGRIWDAVGNFGSFLFDKMKEAFVWLVQNLPGIVQGVIDFFSGLPGKLFGAIIDGAKAAGGAIMDLAKTLWNAIAGFVNEHLIDPIKTHTITILGKDTTPFDFLPDLPKFARGAIVDQPTMALIGEAGREAVIPLDDPARGVAVAKAAGIPQMLGQGNGTGTAVSIGQIIINPPPGATAADANAFADAFADGLADALRRKKIDAAFQSVNG